MTDQPKTRPNRDIDHYDDNVDELLKEHKYLYKLEAKHDIVQALHNYPDLHPKIERCAHSKGGRTEELLTLRGTIPITFKEAKYNIPIQIYMLRTHPKQAPIAFVKPLKNMVIRPSKFVDQNGLIYLRYLVDWKSPRSSCLALCKILSGTFSEQCPVFTEDRIKRKPSKKVHKERKPSKKRRSLFGSLKRLSSRKDQPGTIVRNTEIAETELLVTLDKPEGANIVNGEVEPLACSTSRISQSDNPETSTNRNLPNSEGNTLEDIPDDVLDESLDSLWSSSFESLYSDRSITILAALRNQNIDTNSIFNSSFDSLLSEKSVSYLLELERQWHGRADKKGISPQPSIDSIRDKKELLKSLNKQELRQLRRLSRESEFWPTPPSQSPSSMTKHDSISSENWPALPHVLQLSPTDPTWPEPPTDVINEKPAVLPNVKRRKKTLSLVKELSFEDNFDLSVNEPVKDKSDFDKEESNNIDRDNKTDNHISENELSESDKDVEDCEKFSKCGSHDPFDKSFQNEMMKLDFTTSEHSSSPEVQPRPMTLTKGGIVDRAEPVENKKRWNFFGKKNNKSAQQKTETYCDCKPNRKQSSRSSSSTSLEKNKDGSLKSNGVDVCTCEFNKLEQRSLSVDGLIRKDYEKMDYYDYNANPSTHKQNHVRQYDGGGGLSNGIYEKVAFVNGFSHHHVGRAKIYEPVTFGKSRTKSETSLDCRYKAIGCTVHNQNQNDSLVHKDKAVNHHMDLLLNKVEFLTTEVENLKEKLKILGHNE